MNGFRLLACAVFMLSPALVGQAFQPDAAGQGVVSRDRQPGKADLPGVRRALIICGLAGDDEHRKLFSDAVGLIHSGLTGHHRFAAENVRLLWGDEPTDKDSAVLRTSRGVTSKQTLDQTIESLRAELQPDDALWVFLLGHAHYDGRHSWFNVSDADLNHVEIGRLFEGLACREQVFFVTMPASGFYLKPLARIGRIVITATEPDLEVNATLYPQKLAQAIGAPPEEHLVESDKDGKLTLLDLYLWVARQVAQEYVTGELLATEHALIDDNGDGRGAELQIDYLPEELGGRLRAGQDPPATPRSDGQRAREIPIASPPMPPAPEPSS